MEIITTTEAVSIVDLVKKHEQLFYHQDHTSFTLPVFQEKRLLDPNVIRAYSLAYEKDEIPFRRSGNFPEKEITGPHPPLLEILAWWIALTTLYTQHDMRSYVTPSSTFMEGERLGVYFLVNECLQIGRTYRKMIVIHPDKK